VVAAAAEVVPVLQLARSLTRWLAGGPAGNTAAAADVTAAARNG